MPRSRKTLAAALSPVAFALLLTACGGGGSSSGARMASNDPAPAPTPAPAPDPAPTPPVAMPEPTTPTPDPAPAPDPALLAGEELAKAMANGSLPLPSEHGIASGRIEIAAGAYEDRNGLRFSCTGAEPCIVSVDGGQARVVAGEVRLARLMTSGPTPGPNPPVAMPGQTPSPAPGQLPAYLVMDVARLTSVLGGSALEWGNDQAMSELRTRLEHREPGRPNLTGGGVALGFASAPPARARSNAMNQARAERIIVVPPSTATVLRAIWWGYVTHHQ